jgi:endonuclease/exonuclease/phosphatase (EEP) superfamily protein YafD
MPSYRANFRPSAAGPAGGLVTPVHRSQLTSLSQYVETVEGPVILTGDFNIPRDSPLYRDFLQTTHLTDAFGDSCPPTFHKSHLPANRPAHCIDFTLVAGPTVESARVNPTHPSDHLGLEVRVRF